MVVTISSTQDRQKNGAPFTHVPARQVPAAGGHEERPRACLDNATSSVSAPGQRAKKLKTSGLTRDDFKRLESLQKQGYARVGLHERVKTCGSVPAVKNVVGLGISAGGGLQVCGLQRCCSRWCPDCFGKISRARSEEIKEVFSWAISAGHSVVLVTLTAGHVMKDVLAESGGNFQEALRRQNIKHLFDGLTSAWRFSQQGRAGKKLSSGRVGYSRAFELTLDDPESSVKSGVHGHFHTLLVLEKGVNLEEYKELFFERWKVGCEKAGLICSKKGFDFRPVTSKDSALVSAYLVKGEKLSKDSIAGEMASPQAKVSAGKGRISPEGLLRKIGELSVADVPKYAIIWREIEVACSGRRWLTFSREIRRLASLGEENTDEELVLKEHDVQNDRVAVCPWEEVKDYIEEFREVIRETKEEEKWEILLLMLDSIGVDYEIQSSSEFYLRVSESMRNLRKPPD